MKASRYHPQLGETFMDTERRIQAGNMQANNDYEVLRAATLTAGFPKGQLVELEKICGKTATALNARFQEWQRIYNATSNIFGADYASGPDSKNIGMYIDGGWHSLGSLSAKVDTMSKYERELFEEINI